MTCFLEMIRKMTLLLLNGRNTIVPTIAAEERFQRDVSGLVLGRKSEETNCKMKSIAADDINKNSVFGANILKSKLPNLKFSRSRLGGQAGSSVITPNLLK